MQTHGGTLLCQESFGVGGPLSCFPKYLPHSAATHLHMKQGNEAHSVRVPDKLWNINRCTHTEMETIEWQWHEVIALINALCPQSKLL